MLTRKCWRQEKPKKAPKEKTVSLRMKAQGLRGSELCGGFYHSLDWFQENLNRKPWILPVGMEFSCRFPNKTNPMNHTASF